MRGGWGFLHRELDEFIDVWPAQQRQGERWYAGTADAIQQNLDLISTADPKYVVIIAGDHVYSMDYSLLLEKHISSSAELTLACVETPLAAGETETIVTDVDGRVRDVMSIRTDGATGSAHASMGIYVFNTAFLLERLAEDAANPNSAHALRSNILPAAISGDECSPTHSATFSIQGLDTGATSARSIVTGNPIWSFSTTRQA